MAIPARPYNIKGRLPSLSMSKIAIIVNTIVVRLKKMSEANAAIVPMPVCSKMEVA